MKFFYKFDPKKTFAFIARSIVPTKLRPEFTSYYKNYFSKDTVLDDYLYYWSIDLVKIKEEDSFQSCFCLRDSQGLFPLQEETRKFQAKEEALEFLALPRRIFEPTRVDCLVFNRPAKSWQEVAKKIDIWAKNDKSKI